MGDLLLPRTPTLACIVIASAPRFQLVQTQVLPSVLSQGFDEVLVVGDYAPGEGYRYLPVPPLTKTTTDALVKRDVGTVATQADILVYLCDDHAMMPDFLQQLKLHLNLPWDVLVPSRWCKNPVTHDDLIPLNMGAADGYCGGHAGVYRRQVVQEMPWTAGPHHPLWDRLISIAQQQRGARFLCVPSVAILDLEPEREPWR